MISTMIYPGKKIEVATRQDTTKSSKHWRRYANGKQIAQVEYWTLDGLAIRSDTCYTKQIAPTIFMHYRTLTF